MAQARQPAAIPPTREFREQEAEKDGHVRHDLHTLSWVIELRRLLGRAGDGEVAHAALAGGHCPVPQIGQRPQPPTDHPEGRQARKAHRDLRRRQRRDRPPGTRRDLRDPPPEDGLTFDLIIELDLTDRVAYNIPKFKRYDTFLTAWWSEMRRYQQLGTRPVVLFVSNTPETAAAYARAADETLRASIGLTGSPTHERYYPAREHIFFLAETDIYHGDLTALALPPLPPEVREALEGTRSPAPSRVQLFPERILRAGWRSAVPRKRSS